MLLNLEAIRGAKMRSEPFTWGYVPLIFRSSEIGQALAEAFPTDDFDHYTRHSTAKEYDTYGRLLIKMGHGKIHEPQTLPAIWRDLANELLSDEYVIAVEEAAGISLKAMHLEVAFWRLTDGCTIGPHTDNPLKKLSHLIYFNESWTREQGGYLRILRSWKMDDIAEEFPPLIGTSLILVRNQNSWHGYAPVRGTEARKAIQISFCQCAAV